MNEVRTKTRKKRKRIDALARSETELGDALDEIKRRGEELDRGRCRVVRGVYEEEFNWVKEQLPD